MLSKLKHRQECFINFNLFLWYNFFIIKKFNYKKMKYKILTDNKIEKNDEYKKSLIEILTKQNWILSDDHFDFLFIIGGDGSFLSFINNYLDYKINVVFINSGKLGFYSYVDNPNKLRIDEILDSNNFINIDVLNISHNGVVYKCINDFSFYSNYTTSINISINNTLLEKINGNGVLICTPLGSTARNKSLNGPIILPSTNVISICEIEAINNRYYSSLNSAIVLNNTYSIKLETTSYNKWWLLFDGKQYEYDENNSTINVSVCKSKCNVLLKIGDSDWIRKLNYAFIK